MLIGKDRPLGEFPKNLQALMLNAVAINKNSGILFSDQNDNNLFLSYEELLVKSRNILSALHDKNIEKKSNVIIEISDKKEFFPLFWACILGGIVPVPVTEPVSFKKDDEKFIKLSRIWGILDKPYIITSAGNKGKYGAISEDGCFFEKIICFSELVSDKEAELENLFPDETALIQFSSGSTGDPKGVVLSHSNIINNVFSINDALDVKLGEIAGSWLPHTHDMGLIGMHIAAFAKSIYQIQIDPKCFFRNPFLFAQLLSDHQVNITAMPNFGYAWMIDKINEDKKEFLDFSSLRVCFNGAEPVSVKTLDRFYEHFRSCGFNKEAFVPTYGLAEASLAVTVPELGNVPAEFYFDLHEYKKGKLVQKDSIESIKLIGLGKTITNVSLKITDQDNKEISDGEIGIIKIKGPNVTKGYYKNMENNHELIDKNGWLNTGDMGGIYGNHLFVSGRIKDMIIIRGKNYYSQDIEERICEAIPINNEKIAVIGNFNLDIQDEEIIVFIRHPLSSREFLEYYHKISNVLQEKLDIHKNKIIILPIKKIQFTTSGKKQRYKLRQEYTNGSYNEIKTQLFELLDFNKSNPVL